LVDLLGTEIDTTEYDSITNADARKGTPGTSRASTGDEQLWTAPLLHAIQCFMTLLLSPSEISRLIATGTWGDEEAVRARGWDSRGRHGSWGAFSGSESAGSEAEKQEQERGAREAAEMTGVIEVEWIVGVVTGILVQEGRMGEVGRRLETRKGDEARIRI